MCLKNFLSRIGPCGALILSVVFMISDECNDDFEKSKCILYIFIDSNQNITNENTIKSTKLRVENEKNPVPNENWEYVLKSQQSFMFTISDPNSQYLHICYIKDYNIRNQKIRMSDIVDKDNMEYNYIDGIKITANIR